MYLLRSFFFFFFFNDTATTEIYTLSLHDALPILYDVDADQADVLLRPRARHRRGRGRRAWSLRARRGRRARRAEAVARHDAGFLARPRALPGDVLATLPRRLGPWRLGPDRRRRVLVHRRQERRHVESSREARRSRGGRVGCHGAPGSPRGRGDRRPA